MTDRQPPRPVQNEKPTQHERATVDVDALTRAVERLLRRDLELARERLRGGRRR